MSDAPAPQCFYCERSAVAYCDFRLFGAATCDRPICPEHCQRVGHVCYRGKNKKKSGTIDFCKAHSLEVRP